MRNEWKKLNVEFYLTIDDRYFNYNNLKFRLFLLFSNNLVSKNTARRKRFSNRSLFVDISQFKYKISQLLLIYLFRFDKYIIKKINKLIKKLKHNKNHLLITLCVPIRNPRLLVRGRKIHEFKKKRLRNS